MVKETLEAHRPPDDFAARIGRIVRARDGVVEVLFDPTGISVFNHEVATLDVTEVTQSFEEGFVILGESAWGVIPQVAYSRDLGRLLGLGGERRGEEHCTSARKERAPVYHYWITSSARP
jgi:hypothetical protein